MVDYPDKPAHPPNPFVLAQEVHFAFGMMVVLGATALFPHVAHIPFYGAIVILVIALIKENTYDIWVEGASTLDGFIDWSFYVVGVAVAVVLLVLANSVVF